MAIGTDPIIVIYGREGIGEKDYRRQIDEYKSIHGEPGRLICVEQRDYYDPNATYEEFICARRRKENPNNCLLGWWRV